MYLYCLKGDICYGFIKVTFELRYLIWRMDLGSRFKMTSSKSRLKYTPLNKKIIRNEDVNFISIHKYFKSKQVGYSCCYEFEIPPSNPFI